MKPQLRSFLLTASLLSASIAVQPVAGEETAPAGTEDQEEILLQILELRQQIEDLLAALPPEVQQEVERRWQERQVVPTVQEPVPVPSDAEPLVDVEPTESVVPTVSVVEAEPDLVTGEETAVSPPESSVDVRAEATPPCGGFHLLDTTGDGLVSGGDRQWRFLRLWFDNGDGSLEETELESLFELGVRQIDVNLRFYTNEEGDSEDVDAGELIVLDQVGKGNSARRTGALVVDSDRLSRDGILTVFGSESGRLSGYQPLGAGSFLADQTGDRIPVICPDPQ